MRRSLFFGAFHADLFESHRSCVARRPFNPCHPVCRFDQHWCSLDRCIGDQRGKEKMSDLWAKMPCSWQTEVEKHNDIRGRFGWQADQGASIAALKLYIALCLKANFSSNTRFPRAGCVQKSITDFERLTDLSRPMVVRGMRRLVDLGIVEPLAGRPRVYRIVDYETARYWTKLPRTYLFGDRSETQVQKLFSLPNRSRTTLAALQFYLYIAAVRNRLGDAKVTYNTIAERTGLSRSEISGAISLLVGNDLLSVRQNEDGGPLRACNIYWLRGNLE